MSVKVWLTGSPEALRDLAAILLPAGEVQVLQEGKQYYLAFHETDSPQKTRSSMKPPRGSFCASTALDALKTRTSVR
ncbi:hypothetical protein ACRYGU_03795 [Mycobacteroides abscessus]